MKIKHFFGLVFGAMFVSSAAHAAAMSMDDARMLMQAAKYKDFGAMREMMAQGVNINYRDSEGNTLYCLALKNKDTQTAHVLQSFGGTSQGCPGIDPNYRPPRKTYYEEKSGVFGESNFGQYLLIGGAAAGAAYFLGSSADEGGASDRSATDGANDGGTTTPRPGNGDPLVVPDDPIVNGQFDTNVAAFTADTNMEFYFTSASAMAAAANNYAGSHFARVGVQSVFARGYQGNITNRDAQGNILTSTGGKVSIAVIDTAGVDLYHPDFNISESFSAAFQAGETYDFTYQSTGNYNESGTAGDFTDDIGVASPYYGYDGLEYIDHYATQTAGIIGASLDTQGMHGVAPYATIQSYAVDNSASPFAAFTSAVGNHAGVVTYSATRNLIDTFEIDGTWYSAIDTDYMASSLYNVSSTYTGPNYSGSVGKVNYFQEQMDSGYGTGVGSEASTFYNLFSSGALSKEQRPIMVVSTGNDAMNYDTTIEAAAPMAFPDWLGSFIAVTGVDANNTLYRQDRETPTGHNYTFGSNGCGVTQNWCLAAPADEVLTTAAGTSSVTDWGNFNPVEDITTFISNTEANMGNTYSTVFYDAGNSWWKGSLGWDASYATSFFINNQTGSDLSSVDALYVPLDTIVYDVNKDSIVVGKMMSLGGLGEQTGDWEDWGYKSDTGDWLAYDDSLNPLTGDEFVDFYFIDQNGDGVYTPGDYLYIPMIGSGAATAIVSGGVALLQGAFPHMTNEQVTALLFTTAQDIGTTGVDLVYGHGLMDLDKAMMPYGEIRVPTNWQTFDWNLDADYTTGTAATGAVSRGVNLAATSLQLGAAFGDAVNSVENLSFVGIDEFNRGYSYSMGSFVSMAATLPSLYKIAQDFGSQQTVETQVTDRVRLSMTTRALDDKEVFSSVDNMPVSMKMTIDQDGEVLQASLGEHAFSFFEEQGGDVGAVLRRDLIYNPFMALIDEKAMGVNYAVDLGDTWKVSSIVAYGQNDYENGLEGDSYSLMNQIEQEQYEGHVSVSMLRVAKTFMDSAVSVAFDGGVAYEEKTMLGAVSSGAFGIDGGTTTQFYSMGLSVKPTDDLHFFAGYTRGVSEADVADMSFFTALSSFESSSFHVGATYQFSDQTSFGLMVAEPLRVNKATASMAFATARDSHDSVFIVDNQTINLTPTAHETDVQAFITHKTDGLIIDAGLLYQHNPAHSAYLPDDTTGLVKFKWSL